MEGKEAAVQAAALVLQNAYRNFYTRLTQFPDAQAADFGKGINAADHYARNTLLDDEVGTGRRLAVVGAGLQAYVEGALPEQRLVAHAADGVHLGMRSAAATVVALADDAPPTNNHSAH